MIDEALSEIGAVFCKEPGKGKTVVSTINDKKFVRAKRIVKGPKNEIVLVPNLVSKVKVFHINQKDPSGK